MIDDLELLRRYMNSAPPPPQADLDSARLHLDAEIDREISLVPTTTAGHTRLVRPTDLSQRAWRIRVAFTAAVAILVCAAVVLPLVRTGSPPGRGPTPSSWKLAGYIDHPTFQAQPSSGSEPGALTCPTTTTCYATGLTSPTPNYSAGFGPPSAPTATHAWWSSRTIPFPRSRCPCLRPMTVARRGRRFPFQERAWVNYRCRVRPLQIASPWKPGPAPVVREFSTCRIGRLMGGPIGWPPRFRALSGPIRCNVFQAGSA